LFIVGCIFYLPEKRKAGKKMKKNQLSTTLVKIDQGYIKRHCLDREFWKKSWTVFEYKKFKATVCLNSIQVNSDSYCLTMEVGNEVTASIFPLSRDDYSDNMFNNELVSMLEYIMQRYINRSIVEAGPIYKGYWSMWRDSVSAAEAEADQYCKDHQILDADIIATVKQKFRNDVHNVAYDYEEEAITKMNNDVLAAFCYWLGLKERAADYESRIDPKFRRRQATAYMRAVKEFKAENPEEE
jgi:hypothetical protein